MNDAYYNQGVDMLNMLGDLQREQLEDEYNQCIKWKPIETAPKNGKTIEFNYGTIEQPDTCLVRWSERPVCMGGPTVFIKPGWATAPECDTDVNLPMDAANYWREY